ncbi:MAG: ATP-dependent DNA helicase [Cytophagales bacterium]|nr:MAG: ATP-dependent DNA helicase [Cytophagales bacterium]
MSSIQNQLDTLNPTQREAVEYTEGPLMILAGAGSGKTRVLTYRTAYLISKGVDPFNILSLTFTNKAAREMKNRIEKVMGTDARNLWMGTFHSVFARILRSEAQHIGYTNDFTIYDTEDSKSLIKTIVHEQQLDDKLYKPSTVLSRISGAKNKLISPAEYQKNPYITADDEAAMRPEMGKLYQIYQQRCFKSGAMDFDDLLFNTNILFRDHPEILYRYQNRFKYVMVDEFQDTNLSQYAITRKLAAKDRNICVVGDDAQSIYAFRGADIQNILNFEKDYPELKTIKLEQNYRSTNTIVQAANSIIEKNKDQFKKEVWTQNEAGELIEILKANSDNEEGMLVANAIFEDKMNEKLQNKDFAILYRTNYQSRAFEEALRKKNIPYKMVGGLSFYQRKEIKDLLCYLRYIINPTDEEAFKRIINYPKRGIGDTTVSKLFVITEEQGTTLWDVISNIQSAMPGRAASAIEEFATQIKSFQILLEIKDAFEVASHVAQKSGILKELYDDKTPEGVNKYENIQELLNGIKQFVEIPDNPDKSLGAYLQEITLVTDADTKDKPEEEDKVTLMTIHSAKGLEFRNVYVVGMEEDLFPSQIMLSSRADLEEERRLFYVAITRAEKKLSMSFAISRFRFGRVKPCEPSRFLSELNKNYLKITTKQISNSQDRQSFATIKPNKPSTSIIPKNKTVSYVAPADFKPSDTSVLSEGMKVEHPKFGFGKVTKMDVSGNDRKATIDFNGDIKTLILSFAKLRIHDN